MDEFKLIKKNIWNRIFKKKICSVYKMFTQIGTEEKCNRFHFIRIVIAWKFWHLSSPDINACPEGL